MPEVFGEGDDGDVLDAGGGEELEFARQRSDEGLRVFGSQDAAGVGIEGDGEGLSAEEARAVDDFRDDRLMAEVDAVEVADGGDYRA